MIAALGCLDARAIVGLAATDGCVYPVPLHCSPAQLKRGWTAKASVHRSAAVICAWHSVGRHSSKSLAERAGKERDRPFRRSHTGQRWSQLDDCSIK